MSTNKKADHRLVQPRPEHYKEATAPNGDKVMVLCGPYSVEKRQRFIDLQKELQLVRHPGSSGAVLERNACMKWRNIVFSTIGDEFVPVTGDPKKAKDKVRVSMFTKGTRTITEAGVFNDKLSGKIFKVENYDH